MHWTSRNLFQLIFFGYSDRLYLHGCISASWLLCKPLLSAVQSNIFRRYPSLRHRDSMWRSIVATKESNWWCSLLSFGSWKLVRLLMRFNWVLWWLPCNSQGHPFLFFECNSCFLKRKGDYHKYGQVEVVRYLLLLRKISCLGLTIIENIWLEEFYLLMNRYDSNMNPITLSILILSDAFANQKR